MEAEKDMKVIRTQIMFKERFKEVCFYRHLPHGFTFYTITYLGIEIEFPKSPVNCTLLCYTDVQNTSSTLVPLSQKTGANLVV